MVNKSTLFLRNGKNLNDLQRFQMEKKSNRGSGKYVISTNFLYFSTYLTSFLQSGKHFIDTIYFH